MHHPTSSFLRPARLDEALRWLSEPGSVVLSGGTDFVPERWHRLIIRIPEPPPGGYRDPKTGRKLAYHPVDPIFVGPKGENFWIMKE